MSDRVGRLNDLRCVAAMVALGGLCLPNVLPVASGPPVNRVVLVVPDRDARAEAHAALLRATLMAATPRVGPSDVDVAVIRDDVEEPDLAMRTLLDQHRHVVVVAGTMMLALIIQHAAPQVPIVFDGAADPVGSCLVDSLRRPGRKATGYTLHKPQEQKMLEALLDAYPATRKVVIPYDATESRYYRCDDGFDVSRWQRNCHDDTSQGAMGLNRLLPRERMLAQAALRGIELQFEPVCEWHDLLRLTRFESPRTALLIPRHSLMEEHRRLLAEAVRDSGIAAVFAHVSFVEAGAALALVPRSDPFPHQEAADLVVRILAGADPSQLPVITPKGFRIVIDLRHARVAGQRPSLLALRRADEIRN